MTTPTSPPKAVEQVRKLVESDEVLVVFNPLGTPSNTAIQKYLNSKKVPQLFVATGATKWNDAKNFPWTMGWQPSYQSEAQIYAKYLMKEKPDAKIAILYQNDDFGKDYLKGTKDGFGAKASTMIIMEESYEISEPTIDSHIVKIKAANPDVLLIYTTPKFARADHQEDRRTGLEAAADPDQRVGLGRRGDAAGRLRKRARRAVRGLRQGCRRCAVEDDPGMKKWSAFMDKYMPGADRTDGATGLWLRRGADPGEGAGNVRRRPHPRANVMKQAASLKDFTPDTLLPGVKINTSATDFAPIEPVADAALQGREVGVVRRRSSAATSPRSKSGRHWRPRRTLVKLRPAGSPANPPIK